MREPIFYGGEGAFSFQNCDFAIEKYAADEPWLMEHRRAGIADMVAFAKAAAEIQNGKVSRAMAVGANFTLSAGRNNSTFATISDFNAVNGSPLLEMGDGKHLLFHFNALAEAVYESPFYWMFDDKTYRPTLSEHRATSPRHLRSIACRGCSVRPVCIEA